MLAVLARTASTGVWLSSPATSVRLGHLCSRNTESYTAILALSVHMLLYICGQCRWAHVRVHTAAQLRFEFGLIQ
jgi:hypothetical protein